MENDVFSEYFVSLHLHLHFSGQSFGILFATLFRICFSHLVV